MTKDWRQHEMRIQSVVSPQLKEIFNAQGMREWFILCDAIYAVYRGEMIVFYGQDALDAASRERVAVKPLHAWAVPCYGDADLVALEWACLKWKGSCERGNK